MPVTLAGIGLAVGRMNRALAVGLRWCSITMVRLTALSPGISFDLGRLRRYPTLIISPAVATQKVWPKAEVAGECEFQRGLVGEVLAEEVGFSVGRMTA